MPPSEEGAVMPPSEVRKGLSCHPLRSGTIYVQSNQHWHCFEGNLEQSGERQGGAPQAFSHHHHVTLRRVVRDRAEHLRPFPTITMSP